MKTKNLKEYTEDLKFEEYLGFDPVFDNLPENWFAPVSIFFFKRTYRRIERQMELPVGAKA